MSKSSLLVLCTCPDEENAEKIARALVEGKLAACVSMSAPVTSIYVWQGKTEKEREIQLLIKTSQERYPDLEQAILSLHPYELPEIIAVPVERGLAGYLNWIQECTSTNS